MCVWQARRQAEEELERARLTRLAEQASTTMVTTASLASMDDGDSAPVDALQRLNVIVKVCNPTWDGPCIVVISKLHGAPDVECPLHLRGAPFPSLLSLC